MQAELYTQLLTQAPGGDRRSPDPTNTCKRHNVWSCCGMRSVAVLTRVYACKIAWKRTAWPGNTCARAFSSTLHAGLDVLGPMLPLGPQLVATVPGEQHLLLHRQLQGRTLP